MWLKSIFIFVALLLPSTRAIAQIITVQSFKLAVAGVKVGDLVGFDLDGTVMKQKGTIATEAAEWDRHYKDLIENQNKSKAEARKIAWTIYNQDPRHAEFEAVEPYTVDEIRNLETKEIGTLGVTSRDRSERDVTMKELGQVGIQFNFGSKFKDDLILPESDAYYHQGVIFAGYGKDKGEAVVEYLRLTQMTPKIPSKFLYVDNDGDAVKKVEAKVHEAGIPFLGIDYKPKTEVCRIRMLGLNQALAQ